MKILHLGNIANNAYNNAKFLNLHGEHQHFVLNFDNPHVMACPEWEEVESFEAIDEFSPNWEPFDYALPNWYSYVETNLLSADGRSRNNSWLVKTALWRRNLAYWLKDQGLKKNGNKIGLPVSIIGTLKVVACLPIYGLLHLIHWARTGIESRGAGTDRDTTGYQLTAKKLAKQIQAFDIVEAYGADIIIPYLLNKPYIAYEHGTLRDLPFDGTARAELLSEAYKKAHTTIITNPDVISSAQRLKLKNYLYIPHAVDCERFKPESKSVLRDKFGIKNELIVLAPARQNWNIKGNNKYIEAFAVLVKHQPSARLFICDWGQHRDLTKALVRKLRLESHVQYYTPCPKLTSVHYYQMADIVVDQFEAGAFGGITPEAMACEKPTLVHYNKDAHDWCFNEHPPVVNVSSSSQIADALINLSADLKKSLEIGKLGREWVLKEYSITQLVTRHNQVYDSVANAILTNTAA